MLSNAMQYINKQLPRGHTRFSPKTFPKKFISDDFVSFVLRAVIIPTYNRDKTLDAPNFYICNMHIG